MKYTVNQLYQQLFEKPLSIYEIFKGFFGEDFVDIQTHQGRELTSFKEYLCAKICDENSFSNEAMLYVADCFPYAFKPPRTMPSAALSPLPATPYFPVASNSVPFMLSFSAKRTAA